MHKSRLTPLQHDFSPALHLYEPLRLPRAGPMSIAHTSLERVILLAARALPPCIFSLAGSLLCVVPSGIDHFAQHAIIVGRPRAYPGVLAIDSYCTLPCAHRTTHTATASRTPSPQYGLGIRPPAPSCAQCAQPMHRPLTLVRSRFLALVRPELEREIGPVTRAAHPAIAPPRSHLGGSDAPAEAGKDVVRHGDSVRAMHGLDSHWPPAGLEVDLHLVSRAERREEAVRRWWRRRAYLHAGARSRAVRGVRCAYATRRGERAHVGVGRQVGGAE